MLRQWYFSRIKDIISKSDEWLAKAQNGHFKEDPRYHFETKKTPSGGVTISVYHPSVHWATNAVSEHPEGEHDSSTFIMDDDFYQKYGEDMPTPPKDYPPHGKGGLIASLSVGNEGEVGQSYVYPSHRRKGIANEMYSQAQTILGKPLQATKAQSLDAKALWNQKDRPFGKSEQLAKAILSRTDLMKNDPKSFFEHPTVKDLLHNEIKNMHLETQNSTQGMRSGFQDKYGQNINTSSKSTFPDYYSKLGVKNKDHFAKVMESKRGPIYQRMLDTAHDRLLNGYSNHHGYDLPNPKYLVHAVQHGIIHPQEFHEKMRSIDNVA